MPVHAQAFPLAYKGSELGDQHLIQMGCRGNRSDKIQSHCGEDGERQKGKVNPLRDADMGATRGFRQNLQPDKRRQRCFKVARGSCLKIKWGDDHVFLHL